jgi:hypothetical protein
LMASVQGNFGSLGANNQSGGVMTVPTRRYPQAALFEKCSGISQTCILFERSKKKKKKKANIAILVSCAATVYHVDGTRSRCFEGTKTTPKLSMSTALESCCGSLRRARRLEVRFRKVPQTSSNSTRRSRRRGRRPAIPAVVLSDHGAFVAVMQRCWAGDPADRPSFSAAARHLAVCVRACMAAGSRS